jgi:hypothetical protein
MYWIVAILVLYLYIWILFCWIIYIMLTFNMNKIWLVVLKILFCVDCFSWNQSVLSSLTNFEGGCYYTYSFIHLFLCLSEFIFLKLVQLIGCKILMFLRTTCVKVFQGHSEPKSSLLHHLLNLSSKVEHIHVIPRNFWTKVTLKRPFTTSYTWFIKGQLQTSSLQTSQSSLWFFVSRYWSYIWAHR